MTQAHPPDGPGPRRPATLADWEAVPAPYTGHLIGGRLYVHPKPLPRHARVQGGLHDVLFGPFDRQRGGPGGWLLLRDVDVRVGRSGLVHKSDHGPADEAAGVNPGAGTWGKGNEAGKPSSEGSLRHESRPPQRPSPCRRPQHPFRRRGSPRRPRRREPHPCGRSWEQGRQEPQGPCPSFGPRWCVRTERRIRRQHGRVGVYCGVPPSTSTPHRRELFLYSFFSLLARSPSFSLRTLSTLRHPPSPRSS